MIQKSSLPEDPKSVSQDLTADTRSAKRLCCETLSEIATTELILADLAGSSEALKATYQRFHGMAGIAPTIGFLRHGKAARSLDIKLIGP